MEAVRVLVKSGDKSADWPKLFSEFSSNSAWDLRKIDGSVFSA